MATHLFFVRHGESNSNAEGTPRGRDAMLTEKGRQEAEAVAQRIERIGVDAIISSSYPRAVDTAKPISEKLALPIEESELLVEWSRPSAFIGKHRDEPPIRAAMNEIFGNFGKREFKHSDEETFEEMKKRAFAAIEMLRAHPAERVCVVTHGIFLRMLFLAFLFGEDFDGHEFEKLWRLEVGNTGVSYVRWSEGEGAHNRGWNIVSWNDSAHLG